MNLKNLVKDKFGVKFTYSNIKKILLDASKAFYNKTEKLLTDEEYDELRKFYELTQPALPVGAPVTVGNTLELSHSYTDFAGTLSKCKTVQDVKDWAKNKGVTNDLLVCSIKGDGHSITIELVREGKKTVIDKALTRGEDGVGKDLTDIFRANHKHFPVPQITFECAIGYEAIITYEDFENLSEATKYKYKNPRSAIGGILSNSGKHLFEYLTFVPIRIKAKHDEEILTRQAQFKYLQGLPNTELFDFQIISLDDLESIYNAHQEARNNANGEVNFMYDGLVIETFNETHRRKLGYSSTEPNFATALKFAPNEKATKVRSIKWSTEGFSGKHTPVVHFDPVVINGNTYKQVSLANYGRYKALDLHVGDDIAFTLRHDTLGYVDKLATATGKGKKCEAPDLCVECKEPLGHDDTFLLCVNPACKLNIVGSVYNFFTKTGVMNIGRETVVTLVEHGFITNLPSIFNLDYDELMAAKIPGLGKTSIKNILKEIEKVFSKPIDDYVFLGSLNIPQVSRERSKVLLAEVPLDTILATANLYYDNLLPMNMLVTKVHGIGNIIADNLQHYCYSMQEDISNLLLNHVLIKKSEKKKVSKDFVSLTFCHTGSAKPLKDRKALKELIESKGHKLSSGVSVKTNYLINNDKTSKTEKNMAAERNNVDIISVEELVTMLS